MRVPRLLHRALYCAIMSGFNHVVGTGHACVQTSMHVYRLCMNNVLLGQPPLMFLSVVVEVFHIHLSSSYCSNKDTDTPTGKQNIVVKYRRPRPNGIVATGKLSLPPQVRGVVTWMVHQGPRPLTKTALIIRGA